MPSPEPETGDNVNIPTQDLGNNSDAIEDEEVYIPAINEEGENLFIGWGLWQNQVVYLSSQDLGNNFNAIDNSAINEEREFLEIWRT